MSIPHWSRHIAVLSATGALLLRAPLAGQDPASRQRPPVFRGETNIFHIDVSVHDKNRHHVSGLTAADFSLFENGVSRQVVAMSEIAVTPPAPPTAAWLDNVALDVTTNQVEQRRMIVLVPTFADERITDAIIDNLGPGDVMAIVLPGGSAGQDFTNDRARLRAALARGRRPLQFDAAAGDASAPDVCNSGLIKTFTGIAESLRDVPDRRKVIFYLGTGMALDFSPPVGSRDPYGCNSINGALFRELMLQAQIANANFYPIDPSGLKPPQIGRTITPDLSVEFLQILAENTGGHAIVKNNRPDLEVPRLLEETGSYYLVGYEMAPRDKDGDFYRRIDVKVDRPGVDVQSRTRYYEPGVKPAKADAPPPRKALTAIKGILPERGIPLNAVLAPFAADDGTNHADVRLIMHVARPPAEAPATDALDVVVNAFDGSGHTVTSASYSPTVSIAASSDPLEYDLTSRLTLPPGKFEIRLGIHNPTLDRTGSVYAFVDVPDFTKELLSLSGAIVEARPPVPSIALMSLPSLGSTATPTAHREFTRTDRVTASVRVYQGGGGSLVPIEMAVTLVDDHDKLVMNTEETLAADRFRTRRSMDHRITLPISQLPPGEYLLTWDARRDGKTSVRRDVRFRVK